MQAKTSKADVGSILEHQYGRMWKRLGELSADLVAIYPALQGQDAAAQQMMLALQEALEQMEKAEHALGELGRALSLRCH
jgi:hypothetical protein